jgi:hypothetical protein
VAESDALAGRAGTRCRPVLRALLIFFVCWVLIIVFLVALYFSWLRGWTMTWGATAEDVARRMAGDERLENPSFNATRAVMINVSPEKVWPWIVQMGYKRAGFYALDRLDNAGIPSATSVIPELQNVTVGDSISFGGARVKVVEMVPGRSMLWVFQEGSGQWTNATWSWGLHRTGDRQTKLVSRLRVNFSASSVQEAIAWGFVDVTEILMMRACLLGIKLRAERAER